MGFMAGFGNAYAQGLRDRRRASEREKQIKLRTRLQMGLSLDEERRKAKAADDQAWEVAQTLSAGFSHLGEGARRHAYGLLKGGMSPDKVLDELGRVQKFALAEAPATPSLDDQMQDVTPPDGGWDDQTTALAEVLGVDPAEAARRVQAYRAPADRAFRGSVTYRTEAPAPPSNETSLAYAAAGGDAQARDAFALLNPAEAPAPPSNETSLAYAAAGGDSQARDAFALLNPAEAPGFEAGKERYIEGRRAEAAAEGFSPQEIRLMEPQFEQDWQNRTRLPEEDDTAPDEIRREAVIRTRLDAWQAANPEATEEQIATKALEIDREVQRFMDEKPAELDWPQGLDNSAASMFNPDFPVEHKPALMEQIEYYLNNTETPLTGEQLWWREKAQALRTIENPEDRVRFVEDALAEARGLEPEPDPTNLVGWRIRLTDALRNGTQEEIERAQAQVDALQAAAMSEIEAEVRGQLDGERLASFINKDITPYMQKNEQIVSAVPIAYEAAQMAQQTPAALTAVGDILATFNRLGTEVRTGIEVLAGLTTGGRQAGFAETMRAVDENIAKVRSATVTGGFTADVRQTLMNRLLIERKVLLMAFRAGGLEGQSGNALSNKDFERLQRIIGKTANPDTFERNLADYMNELVSAQRVAYESKSMDVRVKQLKDIYGEDLEFFPSVDALFEQMGPRYTQALAWVDATGRFQGNSQGQSQGAPQGDSQGNPAPPGPPQAAIDFLRQNPDTAPTFDAKYSAKYGVSAADYLDDR